MAKFDVKSVNMITCGPKQNTFSIDFAYRHDSNIDPSTPLPDRFDRVISRTFFGNIGTDETMHDSYATNKSAFYDVNNKIIIHNLYDITKTRLKTTAKKQSVDPTRNDRIEMYAPVVSSDLFDICQLANYAYALTEKTSQSPVMLSADFTGATATDYSYTYALVNQCIDTYLYPMVTDLTGSEAISTYQLYALENELSDSRISSIFSSARDLDGINYHYLLEIPEGTVDNDYDRGYIQANMYLGKNVLNYMYDTQISSDMFELNNCRDYCGIGVCGGQMFMKYRVNTDYKNRNRTVTFYENNPLDQYDADPQGQSAGQVEYQYDSVVHYPMEEERTPYSYQHVEVVHSLNRFDGDINNGHKSSLYSLTLHDTGLNSSTIPENVKSKLRQTIINNIRSVADKICPANTQLFNVYFEGK